MNEQIDKALHWLEVIGGSLPWIGLIVLLVFLGALLIGLVLRLFDLRRLLKQKTVLLELTPPAQTDKTLQATRQLFAVLHGLHESRPTRDKLLRRKVVFSPEVASTLEQGIRYVVRVPESEASTFERTVNSYLPEAKLRQVDDYLSSANPRNIRIVEFKLAGRSFAYPLKAAGAPDQHDLMAYLTGAMTKLAENELIAYQLVVSPAKIRQANTIANRLMHNEELVYQLGKRRLLSAQTVFNAINSVLFGIIDGIGDAVHGPSNIIGPTRIFITSSRRP